MEIHEGIVSEAKQNLFKVGNRFVKVSTGDTPVVSVGDLVAVAGYIRNGFITIY